MGTSLWYDRMLSWTVALCEKSISPPTRIAVTGNTSHGGAGIRKKDTASLAVAEVGVKKHTAAFLAAAEVYLAKITGDEKHLDNAYEYLQYPGATGGFPATATWVAVTALREAGRLTEEDESRLCNEYTREAKGTIGGHFRRLPGFRVFNHAITSANLCDAVARLWPDSESAEELAEEAEAVWNDWWVTGENIEGAPNYEGFNNAHLLQWAERRGERQFALDHPGTKYWMKRGVDHVLPNGFIPGFGDTNNAEIWTQWIGLFALQASWTGDERALWAAERVFNWMEERDWLGSNIDFAERLADKPTMAAVGWWQIAWGAYNFTFAHEALSATDKALKPQAPAYLPKVTHRVIPTHDLIRNESWSLIPPEPGPRIPDQTILKFGPEDASHAAMFSNGRQLWHDHMDTGSVTSYVSDGVVLLDDNGYDQKMPIDHNLFHAEGKDEGWLHYNVEDWPTRRGKVGSWRSGDFQVRGLTGRDVAQVVVSECSAPFEVPVYHERTVLLARRGQLITYDRILPYAADLVGSPLWHVQTVHGSGPGWLEGSVDEFTGRQGVSVRNAPGTVLIIDPFSSDPWSAEKQIKPERTVADDANEATRSLMELINGSHISSTCVSKPVPLAAGQWERFVSVLMPGNRAEDPENAVKTLSRAADGIFALDVVGDLLVVNDSKEITSDCWGSTDAELLWRDAEGVFAHRTQNITVEGISLHSSEIWADIDLSWDGDRVYGHISSEKPTVVTLNRNGKESRVKVFGITEVDELLV